MRSYLLNSSKEVFIFMFSVMYKSSVLVIAVAGGMFMLHPTRLSFLRNLSMDFHPL